MAMGKRKRDRQPSNVGAATDFPTAASHPFYTRLNQLLREHRFDDFAETQCATFYAKTMGRPGVPPEIYFRLLLIGYFEGIGSERGIAWRAADSLALRDFLGVGLEAAPPTVTRHDARPSNLAGRESFLTTRDGRMQPIKSSVMIVIVTAELSAAQYSQLQNCVRSFG